MRVDIDHLTKKFGRTAALDDIALSILPGQIFAIIGLNGAGKTTLFRCLSGIVAPTRGDVRYDEIPFTRKRLDLRRRFVFLPDFPMLYVKMNPLQHIALMVRVYERNPQGLEDKMVPILRDLDLLALAEVPIRQLSRGQIYKTALAGLLAVEPELWLLDEPFASGLDPQGLAVLKNQARQAAALGATIIYSTQILEVAQKFSDRLGVMDRGRLRAEYSRTELDSLPATGPDSIESRLSQFRESSP